MAASHARGLAYSTYVFLCRPARRLPVYRIVQYSTVLCELLGPDDLKHVASMHAKRAAAGVTLRQRQYVRGPWTMGRPSLADGRLGYWGQGLTGRLHAGAVVHVCPVPTLRP